METISDGEEKMSLVPYQLTVSQVEGEFSDILREDMLKASIIYEEKRRILKEEYLRKLQIINGAEYAHHQEILRYHYNSLFRGGRLYAFINYFSNLFFNRGMIPKLNG